MEQFQRDLTYRTSLAEDGLLLTATMIDRFHDLEMEVLVDPETMTITGATAEFRRSPAELCPTVTTGMENLVGTVIGKGLNRRLMELFGRREGCGNIRTILNGLLPLAINVRAARGIEDEGEMLEAISSELSGSCAGYPPSTKE